MRVSKIFGMISLFALSACATAPKEYTFEKSRTFAKSKDEVWEKVISHFATNNIPIKTVEKDSGIIYAENLRFTPGQFADCGSSALEPPISGLVRMNVFVRPVSTDTTEMTVNSDFEETRQFGQYPPTTVKCNSTGALERQVFDSVD